MHGLIDQIAEEHLNRVRIKDDFVASACPFHKGGQERHPSFWIDRSTGRWGCFACQESGKSLKELLRRLGLSSRKVEAEIEEAEKDSAKAFKLDQLKRKKKARASFKGEYVLPEAVLGIFDFLPIDLLEAGFTEETLEKHDIGFDKRNRRITFPIRDAFGSLIGISGRATVPGDMPRYKLYDGRRTYNGKETMGELGEWCPRYTNATVRNHLWGSHLVHEDLSSGEWDQLIIVEGFKAALWMKQCGWFHTVATMGTKMTQSQERIIRQWGPEGGVIILTDNNDPGLQAARQWGLRLATSTFPVYRAYYPEDKDESTQPDDLSETELEEVLSTSQRVGGRYRVQSRKFVAQKQKSGQEEELPWRR